MRSAVDPETYRRLYSTSTGQPALNEIPSATGRVYRWDPNSSYIQEPPFFDKFGMTPDEVCDITMPAPSRSSATRLRRITSPRRARSSRSRPRPLPPGEGGRAGGLQQLWLAARQRPRHDARHVRKRPDQEPHGSRRRRGVTVYQPRGEVRASTTPRSSIRRAGSRSSSSRARSTGPAARATGRPRARAFSESAR